MFHPSRGPRVHTFLGKHQTILLSMFLLEHVYHIYVDDTAFKTEGKSLRIAFSKGEWSLRGAFYLEGQSLRGVFYPAGQSLWGAFYPEGQSLRGVF